MGGYVYRGEQYPSLRGVYLYGDYCTGAVRGLRRGAEGWEHSDVLLETGPVLTSFGQDESGELYVADQAGVWALGVPVAATCGGGAGPGGGLEAPTAHRIFLPSLLRGCGPP